MLTIFAAFVAGVIVGRMKFVVVSHALAALVVVFGLIAVSWAVSYPHEASHWKQYYELELFHR